jgi:hypothetical protein
LSCQHTVPNFGDERNVIERLFTHPLFPLNFSMKSADCIAPWGVPIRSLLIFYGLIKVYFEPTAAKMTANFCNHCCCPVNTQLQILVTVEFKEVYVYLSSVSS